MSQIVDDLRQVAIEIKTETQVGGNTAARVGGAFERVADALDGTQQIADLDAAVQAVQAEAQASAQTIQDLVNNLAVTQETGQSTSSVMSQKAVTDELDTLTTNTTIEYASSLSLYANMAKSNGFPQNPNASSNPNKWVVSNNYYGYWFNVTAYVGKTLRFKNTTLAASTPWVYFFDKIISKNVNYTSDLLSQKFIVPNDGRFLDVVIPPPNATGNVYLWIFTYANQSTIYTTNDIYLVKTIKDVDDEVSDVRDGYLYHTTQLDTTSMTKTARSLGSDDKWLNNNGCNHVVIPCQEGDTFVLTASSDTATGGFYGWLTDAYTPPTSASSIPYVRNNTRIWLSTVNCPATITAPPDAAYLCLITKDGNGNVVIWTGTMKRITLLDDVLNSEIKSEVFNDVADNIDKYVMQPSSYIPTKETATKLMNITGQQGSALYGDYLAVWYLGNKLNIYDVRAKTSVALNVALPTFANTRLHANTMSFGAKYDANDTLPLLYICSGYTDTTSVSTSEVYVVRITESGGTYTATLIQTITLDFGRVNGWTEFVVDAVEGRAWINGCPTASYICVALPDISNATATIDNTTTIIDKFNVKAPKIFGTSTASSGQGRFFWHNRVYYVSGVPSYDGQGEDSLYLIVDNCITHCTEAVVALKNFGLANGTSNTYEPEGCFIWEDEMYIVYRTFVYRLNRN